MSLALLFRDEVNGFYRSKVMIALLIGMPLIAVLMYLLSPDLGGMPLAAFTAVTISSMAGLLASTTLSVSVINERTQGVYDLFLVRPVKRSHLLLAKYLAVVACVVLAAVFAILVASAYDWSVQGTVELNELGQPMLVVMTMACVSCAVAVLVGTLVRSVLLGVILTIYGGNQLSAVIVLTSLENVVSTEASALIGLALAAVVLVSSGVLFSRKVSS
ncbi:MAG: ABC-2 family transporter protein [Methanomassiliicoccales archaeon PtaU1.Bin030]|nr:MAG: ABC-2 family transporter protein [Methanomassiliicoccales archaeon PtaU1.Bin030]